MFPEKESLWVLEQHAKKQKRIFPYSCVYGIKLDKNPDDIVRVQIRNALKALINFYGWTGDKWDTGQTWKICIPIEMSDYCPGEMVCQIVTIDWHPYIPLDFEYVTISFGRIILSETERIEKYCKKLDK